MEKSKWFGLIFFLVLHTDMFGSTNFSVPTIRDAEKILNPSRGQIILEANEFFQGFRGYDGTQWVGLTRTRFLHGRYGMAAGTSSTIDSSSFIPLVFDESYDDLQAMNKGSYFEIPSTGTFLLTAKVWTTTNGTSELPFVAIKAEVNGVQYYTLGGKHRAYQVASNPVPLFASGSQVIALSAGDQLKIGAVGASGYSIDMKGSFSITRVRD